MAIKPILFNTEMVRAILDGRKSCTRRIVKPQWEECPNCKYVHNEYIYDNLAENVYCARCGYPLVPERRAPYQPGDILYVRETWCGWYLPLVGMHYCYRATEPDGNKRPTSPEYDCDVEKISWHPSIHMPKEAARIWLKVTDVRVERLQEMKPVDVIKEGAYPDCWDCLNTYEESGSQCCYGTEEECSQCDGVMMEWEKLWNSTIKKTDIDRYGWDVNPWVWVIEFERCEPQEETNE